MRVAMIGQKGIPFMEVGGGIERQVEEISTRLVSRGHNVVVYARARFVKSHRREYHGVRLIAIPSIPTKNLDAITYTFFATLHALFCRYDIIHYHGVGPSTLAWIPRVFKPRAKIIATFHSIDRFHKKWGPFARAYLAWGEWTACHFPHKTIAVSHILQRYCRQKFGKSVVYIPNGVETEKIVTSERLAHFGLARNGYILTVARLVRHKGIHYLITAYNKLLNKYGPKPHNWPGGEVKKLVIVGAPSYTDDYADYLKKLAEKNPFIIFTGFQTGTALEELFANAYLYAHPSESEGLSVTILEAMSYATPVLISDIPENLEAMDHSGFPFISRDADDLFAKLTHLLESPVEAKQMGAKGQDFIRRNYNWEAIVEKLEKAYKN